MEYISGHTLKELLNTCGVIEEKVAVNWGIQLCEVLSYLHTRNPPVIYRDLKPSNVMRKPDGKIVLIDFGTAREYRGRRRGKTRCAWEQGDMLLRNNIRLADSRMRGRIFIAWGQRYIIC